MDKQYYITDFLQAAGTGYAAAAKRKSSFTAQFSFEAAAVNSNFEGIMAQMAMEEKRAIFLQQAETLHSRQITQAAAAGITLDSQSFEVIQQETMSDFLREADKMRNQGELYALAGQAKGAQARAAGKLEIQKGKDAYWAEVIRGATGMTAMWGNNGRAFGNEGENKDWPEKHEAYEPGWRLWDFNLGDLS